MTRIIELEEIRRLLPRIDVVRIIEAGFVEYSRGHVVVPPVGELLFDDPPGDVHIKYGYIKGDDYYVIKIASGFYHNTRLGLASSHGLMLVFSSRTGILEAALLDHGHLTDIRTAAAGSVAAKHLAPKNVRGIGILGAGIQAELQLRHVQKVRPCQKALFWTPQSAEVEPFLEKFTDAPFTVEPRDKPGTLAAECNLIITCTPATAPLLRLDDIAPGTHITAVGSDTAEKIELDPAILGAADLVVADSLSQSESRGEVFRAVEVGALTRSRVLELGDVIAQSVRARSNDTQISICDLTGVAVQDIQIAKAVFQQIESEEDR